MYQFFLEILNLKWHPNCFINSKVTAILVNLGILPCGGVALGRVCVYSRLVLIHFVLTLLKNVYKVGTICKSKNYWKGEEKFVIKIIAFNNFPTPIFYVKVICQWILEDPLQSLVLFLGQTSLEHFKHFKFCKMSQLCIIFL